MLSCILYNCLFVFYKISAHLFCISAHLYCIIAQSYCISAHLYGISTHLNCIIVDFFLYRLFALYNYTMQMSINTIQISTYTIQKMSNYKIQIAIIQYK